MSVDVSVKNAELLIGLIAPIGVDLEQVATSLKRGLQSVSYDADPIRLTDTLGVGDEKAVSLHERYKTLIHEGNELRDKFGPDVFAHLAIQEVVKRRNSGAYSVTDRRATIFRQFKRTEEIELLKQIYGSNIIFISCHAPRSLRVKYFVDKFTSESRAKSRTFYESQALELISKDEHESDDPNGQRLLNTYAMGDYVLDCSSPQTLQASTDRFIEAFFGYPFISPTKDEYGAHMAYSASLRSADLSRQVGAAIFQKDGEIISLGSNEVPKFGGGTYWTEDEHDARDFRVGHDSNAKIKADLVNDTLSHLARFGWQRPPEFDASSLDGTMIQDLLEFGRVIHAEMNAICDASRFGKATAGAILYCTTLPCHMCSRHIVASGISKVVYLEPYHKSLSRELYPDSIAFDDGSEKTMSKVSFSSFTGVTPRAFASVFSKGRRKDARGIATRWVTSEALPICVSTTYYINLEQIALAQFATTHAQATGAFGASEDDGGSSETDANT